MAVRQEATPTCALSGSGLRGHGPQARPQRDSTCWPSASSTAWTERCLPDREPATHQLPRCPRAPAAAAATAADRHLRREDSTEAGSASTWLGARGRGGEGRVPTEAENRDPGCSHGGRGNCSDLGERENVREAPGEQRLLRPYHTAPVTPRRSSTPRKPRGRPLPRS